jgi:L-lactate dehydrogenase (cytochrome)
MVSSNSSLSPAEIAAARVSPDQSLFFQLYKKRDSALALQKIREVEALGYNAIFLTVDAVVAGNRERDIRAHINLEKQEREAMQKPDSAQESDSDYANPGLGTAGALVANDDVDMTWDTVSFTTS